MEYELTGKDLPELYKDRQDPTFHEGESWELAIAKDSSWVCRVETCGELSMSVNGEWVDTQDIIEKYDTDEKLHEAIEKDALVYRYNNWYEVEFFKVSKKGLEYLDNMADDCVVFDFNEAIEVFKNYMADKEFCEELLKITKGEK